METLYAAADQILAACQDHGLNVYHAAYVIPAVICLSYLWAAFFGKDGR